MPQARQQPWQPTLTAGSQRQALLQPQARRAVRHQDRRHTARLRPVSAYPKAPHQQDHKRSKGLNPCPSLGRREVCRRRLRRDRKRHLPCRRLGQQDRRRSRLTVRQLLHQPRRAVLEEDLEGETKQEDPAGETRAIRQEDPAGETKATRRHRSRSRSGATAGDRPDGERESSKVRSPGAPTHRRTRRPLRL